MVGLDSLATILGLAMLAALTLYALLGGADFGAGAWDLAAIGQRGESQRALIARAIGPIWEVNHIWIILVIVVLFTGFPAAFIVIMTEMHVPLSLMLFGVVLRGSGFTFRAYDNSPLRRRRWSRVFSVPSVVVPVLLGSIVGSLATGKRVGPDRHFEAWWSVFPLVVGLFALAMFAFVAAVYLTLETDDIRLRDDFRVRALMAAAILAVLALLTFLLSRIYAPRLFMRLQSRDLGCVLRVTTGLCALATAAGLWFRRFAWARLLAMLEVVLILWGCAFAMAPYLVPPDITFEQAAAPQVVLRWLLIALALGICALIPSLVFLFRVFKLHALGLRE
jgi:cytochrome d ubiquinol oxidase subunit II